MVMKKPELVVERKTLTYIDYHNAIRYIEKKYNINTRDYLNSGSHFGKWADSKGYGPKDKDAEGKDRSNSKIWYAEYQADPAGGPARPAYQDFWHWVVDRYEISNGGIFTMYVADDIKEVLADLTDDTEDHNKVEDHPRYYIVTILKLIQAEFGDEINFMTNW